MCKQVWSFTLTVSVPEKHACFSESFLYQMQKADGHITFLKMTISNSRISCAII